MVSAYVAGILAVQQGSDGAVDAETFQQHIAYLRNPQNRFAACSILATHGIRNIDRPAIRRNITTLVRLCPTRDAAWDECCGKLHVLAQSDGGDFFSEQCVFTGIFEEGRPLQADEIQIEKDNIKYAIQVLDDFFNGRAHTTDPVPSNSSPMPYAIGRLVGWCRRRKPDDGKPEQKQEV
ncbi:hypothetical protein EV421DRAFT_1806656 [Armillaria borealis]|uniref:Uncharacterized protein n=1 Tax=Armillaria borealis TaxID=47425 RepID=A0AA39MR87_9AGAR|nr:hypothetical protein EV421DRAFT_1806656 [Armillaria borealis]